MRSNGPVRAGVMVALFAVAAACAEVPDVGVSVADSPVAPGSSRSTGESLPASSLSDHGVRVAVPSHCGVLSVTVRGRLWLADPPLGDHNPPPGWDENETMGSFLRTGPRRAIFHSDGGRRASFRRAPVGAEDPNADCE